MNAFNRACMVLIFAAAFLAGAAALFACTSESAPDFVGGLPWLQRSVLWVQANSEAYRLHWVGGSLAGIVLGAAGLIMELKPPRNDRFIIIHSDDLGDVTVSLPGLRRLTEHVSREIEGIAAVDAQARADRAGLRLICNVQLAPDTSANTVVGQLRDAVGSAVSHHVGKPPGRIDVHTRVGAHPTKSRKRVM